MKAESRTSGLHCLKIILHTLGSLCFSHHFCLKSLKSSTLRDIKCCSCLWCKIKHLSLIYIKERCLLKYRSNAMSLCKLIYDIVNLLDDRSLKLLLKLLKFLLKALLCLLESCLDIHDLLLLDLSY